MEELKNPWLPQPHKGNLAKQAAPPKKKVPRYFDANTSNEHQPSPYLNMHRQPSSFNERQKPYSFNGRQRPSFNGPKRPSFNGNQRPSFNGNQRPSFNGNQRSSSSGGRQQPSFNGNQRSSSSGGRQQPSFNGNQRPSFNGNQQPSFIGNQRPSFIGNQPSSVSNEHQQPLSSDGFSHETYQTTVHQSSLGKNNWSDEIYEGLPQSEKGEDKYDDEDEEDEEEYAKYKKNLRGQMSSKPIENKKTNKKEKDNGARGGTLRVEKYPGAAPIDPERLERHSRGEGAGKDCVRSNFHQLMLDRREEIKEEALAQAARAEVMLTENEGFLEAEEGERTVQFTQRQIANAVDVTTATKYFDLKLDNFGPYRMDYNRSGRYLLLGGRKGHVAAMDWTSKKLLCEFNVMEEVFDIKWLHYETMFAVAQKNAVYVYDNVGCEIHRLGTLNKTVRMEFLPYHFLLSTISEMGVINWLDISIGKMVKTTKTNLGRAASFVQNPSNAVLCVGHQGGKVSMWTPNFNQAAMMKQCHVHPVQAMDIDHRGIYMATSAANEVKIWDLRSLKRWVQKYKLRSAAKSLSISQRGLLAMGLGNVVEVYRNGLSETANETYLRHTLSMTQTANLQFCPFEDILGVSHTKGFTSLIIPGAGEPNFDGLEVNPYLTASQRKEAEVKALLEKIQPEFITYDTSVISTVDVPAMVEKLKEAEELQVFVPPKISLSHRKGVKGGTAKVVKTKEILYENARQKFVKENAEKIEAKKKQEEEKNFKWTKKEGVSAVLERFQSQRK